MLENFDATQLSKNNVKIKICLCRANKATGWHKEWKLKTVENLDQEIGSLVKESRPNTLLQNTFSTRVSILVDTLERSRIDKKVLQNHIEIFDIYLNNKNPGYMEKVLEWLKQFDVVHILPGCLSKEAEESVYAATHSLKQKTIIVSPCLATKRPPAPVDFPGHMVISVGCDKSSIENENTETTNDEEAVLMNRLELHWQSCGSALDFLCKGWTVKPARQIKDTWEASYYATGIAALVLVKAHALGE